MKARALFILAGVTVLGMIGSMVALADGPDPTHMYIESVAIDGSGCPQGTTARSIANDRQSMTVIFDQYVVSAGLPVPSPEARKDCTVLLTVHVPRGKTITALTVDARGYVQLAAGTHGVASVESAGKTKAAFDGPIAKDYLSTHTRAITTIVPNSCDESRVIRVDTAIQVTPPGTGSQAQMTMDSLDLKLTVVDAEPSAGC